MTLEAGRERLVLGQARERSHPDVALCYCTRIANACDVCATGAMAAFAVDAQRLHLGAVGASCRVQRDADLASVTGLAVAEAGLVADHSRGWPIYAVGNRE